MEDFEIAERTDHFGGVKFRNLAVFFQDMTGGESLGGGEFFLFEQTFQFIVAQQGVVGIGGEAEVSLHERLVRVFGEVADGLVALHVVGSGRRQRAEYEGGVGGNYELYFGEDFDECREDDFLEFEM